jgi:hypothetical protein
VLTRRFDRLTERATILLDADDPIEALEAFLMFMIDEAPGKIAIGAALLGAGLGPSPPARRMTDPSLAARGRRSHGIEPNGTSGSSATERSVCAASRSKSWS